ncbi:MAG: DUF1285 domain-containing protein [Candidatus Rokubacteria bacterium]|nr:DUF1285 domain-containing protein [Candidatus Rokubacteria bacterium]
MSDPAQWKLPRLTVNREGEWFHEGEEVTHSGILADLWGNLRRDAAGYFLEVGPVRIPVEVADTPFLVIRMETDGPLFRLTVNDGTQEPLDPATLRLTAGDVPYCRVKGGQFEARFSRAAAYQLGQLVEYDEKTGRVSLRVGGTAYDLDRE